MYVCQSVGMNLFYLISLFQGAAVLKPIEKELDHYHYTHHESVAEMQKCLTDMTEEIMLARVKAA